MLIVVSSFGKGLRWEFLTEPAEAIFCPQEDNLSGLRPRRITSRVP